MPLSFRSRSHGNIAFGFFNIESDMLLLEHYFFFADDFCQWITQLSEKNEKEQEKIRCRVYFIADPEKIGDLMGAIHGIRFTGFIGNVYTIFPFPDDPKAFKQNPKGDQTREIVTAEIKNFAEQSEILFEFINDDQIKIGPYLFDKSVFHELIQYVCQGGYPRWKDEIKSPYVIEMEKKILNSRNSFFKGVFSSREI